MNLNEFHQRLRAQKEKDRPGVVFPEGCYGAANSPLVFVGPSPGGKKDESIASSERSPDGKGAFWNYEFNAPFEKWSNGFRASLRPIVEKLLQIPLEKGANKLFAFVNFDWAQNPNSSDVSEARINKEKEVVLKLLNEVRPKIIVALDTKAYVALIGLLKLHYQLVDKAEAVKISTASTGRFHREVKAHFIAGEGELNGCVVLKSLQHPARIFNSDYAERVASTLRNTYEKALLD